MHRLTLVAPDGPHLSLLGPQEPVLHGRTTLEGIEKRCADLADALAFDLDLRQSNHEGGRVDALQPARRTAAGVALNAAAHTHTSVAIRDAVLVVDAPAIEVHLTNVNRRNSLRWRSHLSDVVEAVLVGCGDEGHGFAIGRLAPLRGATV